VPQICATGARFSRRAVLFLFFLRIQEFSCFNLSAQILGRHRWICSSRCLWVTDFPCMGSVFARLVARTDLSLRGLISFSSKGRPKILILNVCGLCGFAPVVVHCSTDFLLPPIFLSPHEAYLASSLLLCCCILVRHFVILTHSSYSQAGRCLKVPLCFKSKSASSDLVLRLCVRF
jgi:hypothetical protein